VAAAAGGVVVGSVIWFLEGREEERGRVFFRFSIFDFFDFRMPLSLLFLSLPLSHLFFFSSPSLNGSISIYRRPRDATRHSQLALGLQPGFQLSKLVHPLGGQV